MKNEYDKIKMVKELYYRPNGGIYMLGDDDRLYIPVSLQTMLEPNGADRDLVLYEAINISIDDIVKGSKINDIE